MPAPRRPVHSRTRTLRPRRSTNASWTTQNNSSHWKRAKRGSTSPSKESQRHFRLMETSSDRALHLIGDTLLKWGCDITAADRDGRTPLMYAVLYNRHTAVRLLVENGANLSARDNQGASALEIANRSGNREVVNWLTGVAWPSKRRRFEKVERFSSLVSDA